MEEKEKKDKNKGGRPSILTPELIKTICATVKAGNYIETAAAVAGIHKDTLYDWLKKASSKGGIYAEFSDAIKKALAESEARDVLIISEASKTNWTAAAWKLERRFAERWGRKDHIDFKGEVKQINVQDIIKKHEGKIEECEAQKKKS